jgi:hypothetical protein
MTNRRVDLLLAAFITVGCMAMLEFSAGIIFNRAHKTNGKRLVMSAITSHDHFVGVKDSYMIPHPYLLYTLRPGYEEFGYPQINSLGYRGHEFAFEKPRGTYRILCLGGSTTLSYPYIKKPGERVARAHRDETQRPLPGTALPGHQRRPRLCDIRGDAGRVHVPPSLPQAGHGHPPRRRK